MIPLLAIIIFMMNFFSSLQTWEGLNDSTCTGFSNSSMHIPHKYSAAIRPPPSRTPLPASRTPLFFPACVHSPYILVPHQRHTFPIAPRFPIIPDIPDTKVFHPAVSTENCKLINEYKKPPGPNGPRGFISNN